MTFAEVEALRRQFDRVKPKPVPKRQTPQSGKKIPNGRPDTELSDVETADLGGRISVDDFIPLPEKDKQDPEMGEAYRQQILNFSEERRKRQEASNEDARRTGLDSLEALGPDSER